MVSRVAEGDEEEEERYENGMNREEQEKLEHLACPDGDEEKWA